MVSAVMDTQSLRILAIEPDAACREHLRALLVERTSASLEIVATADAASIAMHANRPDLILLSAVLPPRAEEQVIDTLKHLDPDGAVPVITVPPLLERHGRVDERRNVLSLISRRPSSRPSYDATAVVARIDEALRQVLEAKEYPRIRAAHVEASTGLVRRDRDAHLLMAPGLPGLGDEQTRLVLERKRLERARRFGADELTSRCTLTTPNGFIVRMLNVSESGVLFESPLKFTRDSEMALSLFGPQTTLILPARIVRSEVAAVNGVGVTYQTAAQFGKTLDFVSTIAPPGELVEAIPEPVEIVRSPASPASLADMVVRIATEVYQHQRIDAARAAFEAGLRQLVPACAVTLSEQLVQSADGGDSIYFAVPGASGLMMQATFEPGHQPTSEEFKLLRAASAMASVIVHSETRTMIRRTA
jgi:PilZ domain-containing protein